MMKKFLVVFLLFALLLTACGKKNPNPTEDIATVPAVTEAPVQTEPATEAPTEPATEETMPGVEESIFDETETDVTGPTETIQPDEPVAPTTPAETKPSTSTEPTKPSGSGDTATEPTKPQETTPAESEYEKFHSMSSDEQQQHMDSFGSVEEFFDWYNQVKDEHEAANPPIEVGDGSIDMDAFLGN